MFFLVDESAGNVTRPQACEFATGRTRDPVGKRNTPDYHRRPDHEFRPRIRRTQSWHRRRVIVRPAPYNQGTDGSIAITNAESAGLPAHLAGCTNRQTPRREKNALFRGRCKTLTTDKK